MPYSLLFGSGDDRRSNDFYKSTTQLSQTTTSDSFGIRDRSLERSRARAVVKEKDSAYRKSTETRALNSHQLSSNGIPHCSIGDTADLPNFKKMKPYKCSGFKIEPETPREEEKE